MGALARACVFGAVWHGQVYAKLIGSSLRKGTCARWCRVLRTWSPCRPVSRYARSAAVYVGLIFRARALSSVVYGAIGRAELQHARALLRRAHPLGRRLTALPWLRRAACSVPRCAARDTRAQEKIGGSAAPRRRKEEEGAGAGARASGGRRSGPAGKPMALRVRRGRKYAAANGAAGCGAGSCQVWAQPRPCSRARVFRSLFSLSPRRVLSLSPSCSCWRRARGHGFADTDAGTV
eukprot:365848-Chlamydomonas_euryale.AAC.2